jgi:hypothetical protein
VCPPEVKRVLSSPENRCSRPVGFPVGRELATSPAFQKTVEHAIWYKHIMKALLFVVTFSLTALAPISGHSQTPNVHLPIVTAAQIAVYPPLARTARIQGIVHVSVTTDGDTVVAAHVLDGHWLLAQSAEENVRTWKFASNVPLSIQ